MFATMLVIGATVVAITSVPVGAASPSSSPQAHARGEEEEGEEGGGDAMGWRIVGT